MKNHCIKLILISTLVLLSSLGSAFAATWTVCAVGCDFTTIQAAHDAVNSGDTISVTEMNHTEWGITISKDLTIAGVPHSAIWADEQDRLFTITTGATVVLQELDLGGGLVTSEPCNGGGILNNGELSVFSCTIYANTVGPRIAGEEPSYGGGIYSSGPLTLTDCLFFSNTSQGDQQVVSKSTSTDKNGFDQDVRSKEAYTRSPDDLPAVGGGVYSTGQLTLINCFFVNNLAIGQDSFLEEMGYSAWGGGLYHTTGNLCIEDSTFEDNHAYGADNYESPGGNALGGGIYAKNCQLELTNLTVNGNSCSGGSYTNSYPGADAGIGAGGGMHLSNCISSAPLNVLNIQDNSAVSGLGGCLQEHTHVGGGLIANNCSLTIQDSNITGNWGGGIFLSGTNQILSTDISQNTVLGGQSDACSWYYESCPCGNGGAGTGGGIHASGDLTLDGCTISANLVRGGYSDSEYGSGGYSSGDALGGGLYHSNGTLVVTNSLISANSAQAGGACFDSGASAIGLTAGGGIYAGSGISLTNSEVKDNTLTGGFSSCGDPVSLLNLVDGDVTGGGLYVVGSAFIENTTFSGNTITGGESDLGDNCWDMTANLSGGDARGAGLYANGNVSINRSTFDSNVLAGGSPSGYGSGSNVLQAGSGYGAGIYNASIVTLINSTITQNEVQGGNASGTDCYSVQGGGGLGAGIYNYGTLAVTSSTFSINEVQGGTGTDLDGVAYGGNLYNQNSVQLDNTIVAGGLSTNLGPDLYGSFVSNDYNLIQNTSDSTITGTTTHNIYGADPSLGALQDNGGSTWTLALLAGSLAIDAGNCSISGMSVDQRGLSRPFDDPYLTNIADGCDIGAVERQDSTGAGTYYLRGHVYLQGQTDHSGTTVALLSAVVPTLSLFGVGLLLVLLPLGMRFGRHLGIITSGFLFLFIVITGVQAALAIITSPTGLYYLSPEEGGPFEPGQYTITFEHPGYTSQIVIVTIPELGPYIIEVEDVTLLPDAALPDNPERNPR
ncbi:hypothetical protein JXQ70_11195 [bacterium]|nr:hypothetical protein [bacterium]